MTLAFFSLGLQELVILALVGMLLVLPVCAVIGLLLVMLRNRTEAKGESSEERPTSVR
jgi:hypothetical protein